MFSNLTRSTGSASSSGPRNFSGVISPTIEGEEDGRISTAVTRVRPNRSSVDRYDVQPAKTEADEVRPQQQLSTPVIHRSTGAQSTNSSGTIRTTLRSTNDYDTENGARSSDGPVFNAYQSGEKEKTKAIKAVLGLDMLDSPKKRPPSNRSERSTMASDNASSQRESAMTSLTGDQSNMTSHTRTGWMARNVIYSTADLSALEKPQNPTQRMKTKCRSCCRKMLDNPYFVGFTFCLTIFVLLSDDVRVRCFEKSADIVFSLMTAFCIVIFTIEITVSCIGKDDYICGFFFFLDVISAATLLMDVDLVTDAVFEQNRSALEKARSGSMARLGAKAGRVVRVLRLVRILKLYKAIYEARQVRRRNRPSITSTPHSGNSQSPYGKHGVPLQEDDWDDDEEEEESPTNAGEQESRVGKRLSELTTRRVIILVLTMLLVTPILNVQSEFETPSSGSYGADAIWEAFVSWSSSQLEADRLLYEQAVLRFIYYHNWYGQEALKARTNFVMDYTADAFSHLFWIGMVSDDPVPKSQVANARLRLSTILEWPRTRVSRVEAPLPLEVEEDLAREWTDACSEPDTGTYFRGVSLLQREIEGIVDLAVRCPSDLRTADVQGYGAGLQPTTSWQFVLYFDRRPYRKTEALYGIILTCFVCLVLVVASLLFANDANQLVLQPLEHMMNRVRAIRRDPLSALKMADDELLLEQKKAAKKAKKLTIAQKRSACGDILRGCLMLGAYGAARKDPLETVILEKTIVKLGSLLALGFGQAGATIISHNLAANNSAGVNVMIPGTKVSCVIAEARIRDFSTATEVLQGKVMTFVNQIAEVVYGIADEYFGGVNKFDADTFLLIWRLSDVEEYMITRLADLSVAACIIMLGSINRSLVLASYRTHPGLQQRLGSECRVCVSFGLHAGWAIEGAVGTEFKIDASYLSPNVSIAQSVQKATAFYNVPIIASQAVVQLNTQDLVEHYYRLIDCVNIRGSVEPLKIYSIDFDYRAVTVEKPFEHDIVWSTRQRFKVRQFIEAEKTERWESSGSVAMQLQNLQDVAQMRQPYTTEFKELFKKGYWNYFEGEWSTARQLFQETLNMLGDDMEDGPSLALLHYMETPHDFQPPKGWQGVRELSTGELEEAAADTPLDVELYDEYQKGQKSSFRGTVILPFPPTITASMLADPSGAERASSVRFPQHLARQSVRCSTAKRSRQRLTVEDDTGGLARQVSTSSRCSRKSALSVRLASTSSNKQKMEEALEQDSGDESQILRGISKNSRSSQGFWKPRVHEYEKDSHEDELFGRTPSKASSEAEKLRVHDQDEVVVTRLTLPPSLSPDLGSTQGSDPVAASSSTALATSTATPEVSPPKASPLDASPLEATLPETSRPEASPPEVSPAEAALPEAAPPEFSSPQSSSSLGIAPPPETAPPEVSTPALWPPETTAASPVSLPPELSSFDIFRPEVAPPESSPPEVLLEVSQTSPAIAPEASPEATA